MLGKTNSASQGAKNQDIEITENGTYIPDDGYTGFGTVTVDVDAVNNQDLTITENGVYNASENYTGLGTVTVNVESSDSTSITAINKTGATINQGDKVWINENVAYTKESDYQITTSSNPSVNQLGVIDRSGTKGTCNNYYYDINSNSATQTGSSIDTARSRIMYVADNTTIIEASQPVSVDKRYVIAGNKYALGDDLFINYNGNEVYQIDMSNGTVLKTFTASFIANRVSGIKIGDYIYDVQGSNQNHYKTYLDYDNTAATVSSYTISNVSSNTFKVVGVTNDNKYIICSKGTLASNLTTGQSCYLYLIEVLEDGNLRGFSDTEIPEIMQKWLTNACGFNFNPYTGILCVHQYSGSDYGIYKYKGNGIWEQLPVDLGMPENSKFYSSITVSDDLTRACYGYYISGATSTRLSRIVNLVKTKDGTYVAESFEDVNIDTITGFATEEALPDASFEAELGTIKELGMIPNFKAINLSLAPENCLTYNSNNDLTLIKDLSKLDKFGGQQTLTISTMLVDPAFGNDLNNHNSFRLKFKINSLTNLVGASIWNGSWDGTSQCLKFTIPDDSHFGLELYGVEDDTYTSPLFASVSFDNSLVGEWITLDVTYDVPYWKLIPQTESGTGYSSTYDVDIQNNISSKALFNWTDINLFAHTENKEVDIDVDLADSGFKKNSEWAVRFATNVVK